MSQPPIAHVAPTPVVSVPATSGVVGVKGTASVLSQAPCSGNIVQLNPHSNLTALPTLALLESELRKVSGVTGATPAVAQAPIALVGTQGIAVTSVNPSATEAPVVASAIGALKLFFLICFNRCSPFALEVLSPVILLCH